MTLTLALSEIPPLEEILSAFTFGTGPKQRLKTLFRPAFAGCFFLLIGSGIIARELTVAIAVAAMFGAFRAVLVVFEVLLVDWRMLLWLVILFEVDDEGPEVLVEIEALLLAG